MKRGSRTPPGAPSAEQLRKLVDYHRAVADTGMSADDRVRRDSKALAELYARGLAPERARRFRGRVLCVIRCERRGCELAVVYPTTIAPVLVHRTAHRPDMGPNLRRRSADLQWLLRLAREPTTDPWFEIYDGRPEPVTFRTDVLDADSVAGQHFFVCHCGASQLRGSEIADALAAGRGVLAAHSVDR